MVWVVSTGRRKGEEKRGKKWQVWWGGKGRQKSQDPEKEQGVTQFSRGAPFFSSFPILLGMAQRNWSTLKQVRNSHGDAICTNRVQTERLLLPVSPSPHPPPPSRSCRSLPYCPDQHPFQRHIRSRKGWLLLFSFYKLMFPPLIFRCPPWPATASLSPARAAAWCA